MHKFVTSAFVLFFFCLSSAQLGTAQDWTAVNNGLSTTLAPSIVVNAETVYVSVYGGGVYKSTDYGDNWTSISAGLNTVQVSTIELAPYVLAGTDSGVYMRLDESTWQHLSTVGMTNTIVRSLALTPDSSNPRLNVCTPGGIFRQLHISDWESANNGLSGAALDTRSLTAYKSASVNYGITATADGVYMTFDDYATWEKKSNGLVGSALRINKVMNLGSPAAIAATDSGLYATTDVGENWITVFPSERFMTGGAANYPGTGLAIYFFGDKGYATTNLSTWLDVSLSGTTGGPVIDFAATQNYFFVTTPNGGVFRKALPNITNIDENVTNGPRGFELSQNYPNPFNPATRISYSVVREGFVSLIVYDMLGKEVANLIHENKEPGEYSATWNADGMPSGVYYYRLVAGDQVSTNKMVLMR